MSFVDEFQASSQCDDVSQSLCVPAYQDEAHPVAYGDLYFCSCAGVSVLTLAMSPHTKKGRLQVNTSDRTILQRTLGNSFFLIMSLLGFQVWSATPMISAGNNHSCALLICGTARCSVGDLMVGAVGNWHHDRWFSTRDCCRYRRRNFSRGGRVQRSWVSLLRLAGPVAP